MSRNIRYPIALLVLVVLASAAWPAAALPAGPAPNSPDSPNISHHPQAAFVIDDSFSGNTYAGIVILGQDSSGNRVGGNVIGLPAVGDQEVGNGALGIDLISVNDARIGGSGLAGIPYNFDASVTPANATLPIAYTWTPAPGSGQGTAAATYTWSAAGSYSINVADDQTYGAYGETASSTLNASGVYGRSWSGATNGVWGHTSSTTNAATGVYGLNNSVTNGTRAGLFYGDVTIVGDLGVTGGKNAIAITQGHGPRLLYAGESPENWFEDLGTAQMADGAAVVAIEPIFAQTVDLNDEYHVFLTPIGQEAVLLFVSAKGPAGFTVQGRDLQGQPSSCAFDYRFVARRLGYEYVRLRPVSLPTFPVSAGEENKP